MAQLAALRADVAALQPAELAATVRARAEAAAALVRAREPSAALRDAVLDTAAALWNRALDVVAVPGDDAAAAELAAELKSAAVDLQWAQGALPPAARAQLAAQALSAGRAWAELERWEAGDAAAARALELAPAAPGDERAADALEGALLLRLRAALRLGQELPAAAALARLRSGAAARAGPAALKLLRALTGEGRAALAAGRATAALRVLRVAHEVLAGLEGAGAELAAAGALGEARALGEEVLALLAWAHLGRGAPEAGVEGGAEAALACVEQLRALGDADGPGAPAAAFLAHAALLAAGRAAEAAAELAALATHEAAPPELVAAALAAALAAPGCADGAREALAAARDAWADDAALAADLTAAALGGAAGAARAAAPRDPPGALDAGEEAVLELAGEERVREALAVAPGAAARMRALLWNHATELLEAGAPGAAAPFYAAAGELGAGAEAADEALRARAACALAAEDWAGAAALLESSATPGGLVEAMLRLKARLGAGDADGAATALGALAAAPGANADILRVACCEALEAGAPRAAREALAILLERARGDADFAAALPPGAEAAVFQNLVALLLEMRAAEGGGGNGEAADGEAADAAAAAAHFEALARVLDAAAARLEAAGDAFLGAAAAADGHSRLLEWLAGAAWNAGRSAARAGLPRPAAVLLAAAAALLAHPAAANGAGAAARRRAALVMAAAAALEEHGRDASFAPALALAERHLAAARGAGSAERSADEGGRVDAYACFLEFDLAARRGDAEGAAAAVERARGCAASSPDLFARMAALARAGGDGALARAAAGPALRAAVERLAARAAPDRAALAGALRALFEAAGSDEERLAALGDAAGLLAAAPRGAWPAAEARWLVAAAWNRGATCARFGRRAEALRYWRLALEAGGRAGGLGEHEARMRAALAEAEEAVAAEAPCAPA
jgi:hypothetical protein